jgi:hypothetical protein
MLWQGLLQTKNETITLPWIGGRNLRLGSRCWHIEGDRPQEFGWVTFILNNRKAKFKELSEPKPDLLKNRIVGYLVGDRIVPKDAKVNTDPKEIVKDSERVYLIEPGIDRFVLVSAGRVCEDGSLCYIQQEMPLGPEEEVQSAFLDGRESISAIKNVTPALDAAFRMEIWQRKEVERRRLELEERLRKEEEERQREARRQEIVQRLGDGAGRREMALVDFAIASKSALAVGGAEYLDHRLAVRRNEMVVKFRLNGRRYECVCNSRTLQIIDAGICLTDEATGEKGDSWLTLESLPGVILQADAEGRLVVFRHVA